MKRRWIGTLAVVAIAAFCIVQINMGPSAHAARRTYTAAAPSVPADPKISFWNTDASGKHEIAMTRAEWQRNLPALLEGVKADTLAIPGWQVTRLAGVPGQVTAAGANATQPLRHERGGDKGAEGLSTRPAESSTEAQPEATKP